MGRAYEVRKASIQKTGAAKAKLYSMYAREIYAAAKTGGIEPSSNASLKRLIEKAKKEQVPADIIKRAIDKVGSGADETYVSASYELFGPSGSTMIVECLTDNVNRSVSSIRTVVNKCHIKMGAMGSVSYMYDHLAILSTKDMNEEEVMDAMIESGVDVTDIEKEEDQVVISGDPSDLFAMKEALTSKKENLTLEMDEITYLPKEKITLTGEDLEIFEKAINMLEDIEDVQNVYHNVELG